MVFTTKFFLFLALGFLPILGGTMDTRLFWFGLAYDAGVFLVAVIDYRLLVTRSKVRIQRHVPAVVSIGVSFEVTIEVENVSPHRLRLTVKDSPPHEFEVPSRVMAINVAPHTIDKQKYTLRANVRGRFEFQELFYRARSVTGLCERQVRLQMPATVKVYPNLKNLSQVELAIAHGSRQQLGLRLARVLGEGHEFESLRPYMRDDDYRWIDWKATARRSQLISREYESERNQRLMILLDAGRLMAPKVGDFRKLDYAVNAAAMLCQVGLMKGDMVGLQVFSNEIVSYQPPKQGRGQLVQIVDTLFQAQPRRFESDYAMAFANVARRNSRRSLVVCFTDLLDSESSRSLIHSMWRLLPKHLPICVTISDSDLLAARHQTPQVVTDVFEKLAAMEVWDDYRRALGLLEGRGVAVVNVPAHELTSATINRYLEIKSRGML
ncbi:MAG: DUF58 domain-containing protein [Verrucomicrobiae bacterium]|nr:DUF58 domain-containing protein [Verrucomicrobiae bacterium]